MAVANSSRKIAYLLTFTWGATPTIRRYTSWTRPLVIGGNTFESEPSIEVTPGPSDGGVEEKPWKVQMNKVNPLDLLCRPYRFAEVKVDIEEYDPADETRELMYSGNIIITTNRKNRQPKLCEFKVGGVKVKLKYRLGVMATNTCAWVFGSPPCCYDIEPLQQTVTLDDITDDLVMSFPALALPQGGIAMWYGGSASFDGLTIDLQYAIDQQTLVAVESPPPEWIGEDILLTPSCPGTLEACRMYGNEQRFGGIGIAMPDYNPLLGNKK